MDKFIAMQKIKGNLYPPKSNKNPPNRGPIACPNPILASI